MNTAQLNGALSVPARVNAGPLDLEQRPQPSTPSRRAGNVAGEVFEGMHLRTQYENQLQPMVKPPRRWF
jgi:hypothetical protein